MVVPSHVVASMIPERCRCVYVMFAKIKNRVLGRMGRPTQRVLMGINVDMVESESTWKGTGQLWQSFRIPLENTKFPWNEALCSRGVSRGVMVTIKGGGELLLK